MVWGFYTKSRIRRLSIREIKTSRILPYSIYILLFFSVARKIISWCSTCGLTVATQSGFDPCLWTGHWDPSPPFPSGPHPATGSLWRGTCSRTAPHTVSWEISLIHILGMWLVEMSTSTNHIPKMWVSHWENTGFYLIGESNANRCARAKFTLLS